MIKLVVNDFIKCFSIKWKTLIATFWTSSVCEMNSLNRSEVN